MIRYTIFKTIDDVPESWDNLAKHDVFLCTTYLKALEEALPSNISMYYIGVYKENLLVGVAVIQRVRLYLKDMFRETKVSCIKSFAKDTLSKVLKGNILVVGNLTHTGQHGLYVDTDKLTTTEFYTEVFKGIKALEKIIKKEYQKTIRLILVKDFFPDDPLLDANSFKHQNLQKAIVQPNMVMDLKNSWSVNADYIACLTKKYRTRYRRARKKLNSITCKEMDIEAIRRNTKRLHELYLNVSQNAKFNTFILPEQHFLNFKVELKDNFRVFGYYLNEELVGFFTLILNNEQLETYFLGYDTKHQYPNQLYLNMLYDMANFAIEHKFKRVVYARTAMEIKSSVGAKPKPMVMYLKHTNGVLNTILKPVFGLMNPSTDWKERHPFK